MVKYKKPICVGAISTFSINIRFLKLQATLIAYRIILLNNFKLFIKLKFISFRYSARVCVILNFKRITLVCFCKRGLSC